ncbi:MAG: tRNA (adenosine(37)-N6)-dimethylallyltransferase MiaA [Desulfobacteraceae bacterium]|nr:MAG: tRNA (adenosine(37)-N6)-dimethylallyltransferase MiaA [Desulfobacteraceae bacterium]
MKIKAVVICGPTGIGKTSFAIELARMFNGEIINADSMQIYKYMDIGTAKPTREELALARHHMVDIVTPDETFDAGAFAAESAHIISELHQQDKLPIIAGGTGLYIKSLLYGLFRTKPADQTVLSRLELELETSGSHALYDRLAECDPKAAQKIHPNDGFRIIRALEVFETSGKPISQHQGAHQFRGSDYDTVKIGLQMDRKKLYQRINTRVDLMMEQGLVQEVERLVDMGYDFDLKPMQSIGYKHAGMVLKQESTLERAVELLKRDTRRYAKRQFTWFSHQENCQWLAPDQLEKACGMIKEFLTSP